jgi:hypothetical protein
MRVVPPASFVSSRQLALLASLALSWSASTAQELPRLDSVSPAVGSIDTPTTLQLTGENLANSPRAALIPGGPVLIGRSELLVDSYDVARGQNIAMVAFFEHVDKFGGVRLIDVTDRDAPRVVGSFDTVDMGQAVGWTGSLMVTATLNPYTYVLALRVVDISDPTAPREIGIAYHPSGYPQSLVIVNELIYVAAGTEGILIFDLSDPAQPVLRGQVATRGFSYGLVVRDGVAAVADGPAGLRLVDVSVPESPLEIGAAATAGLAYDVVIRDNLAYVSDPLSGVHTFDLSQGGAPIERHRVGTPGSPAGLWLQDDKLLIADGPAGLTIVDLSQPAAPRVVGNAVPPSGAQTTAVTAADGVAYLSDFFQGLVMFDISRPATPNSVVAEFALPADAKDAVLVGDLLYVAAGEAGLFVYDATDRRQLAPITQRDTLGSAEGIAIAGSLALVADGFDGLYLYDLTDPRAPTQIAVFDTPGSATSVSVRGSRAYVADDNRGLRIIDISQPTAPRAIGFYDTPGRALRVVVNDTHAFVADFLRGVQIISLSDPARPTLVANFDTAGRASGLELRDTRLLVADDFNGVLVLDVSQPSAPQAVGSLAIQGTAVDLASNGDTVFVATGGDGVAELDASDPTRLFLLARYDTGGTTRAIAGGVGTGSGELIVADSARGLAVIQPNPRLEFITSKSNATLEAVAPAGFAAGPYHVRVGTSTGLSELLNAYSVCPRRSIAVSMKPQNFNPVRPTLPLPWIVTVTRRQEELAASRARVLLPELDAPMAIEREFSDGPDQIELRWYETGHSVLLRGQDPRRVEQLWDVARRNGSFAIGPFDGADQFGPLEFGPLYELGLGRSSLFSDQSTRVQSALRYTLIDGSVRRVEVSAHAPEPQIEGFAADDLGCEAKSQVGLRGAIAGLCAELTVAPSWCDGLTGEPTEPQRKRRRLNPSKRSNAKTPSDRP